MLLIHVPLALSAHALISPPLELISSFTTLLVLSPSHINILTLITLVSLKNTSSAKNHGPHPPSDLLTGLPSNNPCTRNHMPVRFLASNSNSDYGQPPNISAKLTPMMEDAASAPAYGKTSIMYSVALPPLQILLALKRSPLLILCYGLSLLPLSTTPQSSSQLPPGSIMILHLHQPLLILPTTRLVTSSVRHLRNNPSLAGLIFSTAESPSPGLVFTVNTVPIVKSVSDPTFPLYLSKPFGPSQTHSGMPVITSFMELMMTQSMINREHPLTLTFLLHTQPRISLPQ